MRTVAIAGVGLIGGSFAMAIRKAGWQGTILGVSSPATIAEALRLRVIDQGVTLEEAAARADLIYLAQPIGTILSTIDALKSLARPGCLITDAGSTKVEIVRRASGFPQGQFLGGHPMAGKESRGVAAGDPDLFRGRTYVLTPRSPEELETTAAREFMSLLTLIGAVTIVLHAAEHDAVVAFTSHLPQLASTALAVIVGEQIKENQQLSISGSGLQDTTRLALSSWDVWGDIVATNTANMQHALSVYIDKLTEMRDNLHAQRLGTDFAVASEAAGRIRGLGGGTPHRRGG